MSQNTVVPNPTTEYIEPQFGAFCRPGKCSRLVELRQKDELLEQALADLATQRAENQALTDQLLAAEALGRMYRKMLFGQKSEKQPPDTEAPKNSDEPSASDEPPTNNEPAPESVSDPGDQKKKRGAQPGHKGHGRKIPPEHLPRKKKLHKVPEKDRYCPNCGKPRMVSGWTEGSFETDINWAVEVLEHERERMFNTCDCPDVPKSVTAPLPPKVIPKCMYSHQFIAHVLTYKYEFQIPLNRIISMFAMQGVKVNAGTLSGIFEKLTGILKPLYVAFQAELQNERKLHVDETGFFHFGASMQFTEVEVQNRKRCWLWVFSGDHTTFFALDPSRSSSVPLSVLGKDMQGVLISDLFSAYIKYLKEAKGLSHALCWVHFRRFFKDAAVSFPELQDWASQWVERIAGIFKLNDQRVAAIDDEEQYVRAQIALEQGLEEFHSNLVAELKMPEIHDKQFKVLTSATKNWPGYTVFVSDPRIPLDNNEALSSGSFYPQECA